MPPMPDEKPTLNSEDAERLRRRKGALAGLVIVVILAILLAGLSEGFHIDVGATITGPATATQPGGVTTYNYHVGVFEQPSFWYRVLVFIVLELVLCVILAKYRKGARKH